MYEKDKRVNQEIEGWMKTESELQEGRKGKKETVDENKPSWGSRWNVEISQIDGSWCDRREESGWKGLKVWVSVRGKWGCQIFPIWHQLGHRIALFFTLWHEIRQTCLCFKTVRITGNSFWARSSWLQLYILYCIFIVSLQLFVMNMHNACETSFHSLTLCLFAQICRFIFFIRIFLLQQNVRKNLFCRQNWWSETFI